MVNNDHDDNYAPNSNISELDATSDKVKDAIIECAREEVRNFLYEITSPLSTLPLNEKIYHGNSPHNHQKKSGKRSKSKYTVRRRLSKSARPVTAPSVASSRDNVLSTRTKSAYNLIRQNEGKEKCRKGGKIGLDKIGDVPKTGYLSCAEVKEMSFASSILIKRSARLISDHSGETGEEERIKSFQEKAKNFDDSLVKHQISAYGYDVDELEGVGDEFVINERPRTISGRIHRPFNRSTSSLERRIALSRPSTAHLVRAKAEEFSMSLLNPLPDFQINESNSQGNKAFDEHEWENELAKHIVSVFNSKIVSDSRNQKQVKPLDRKQGCFCDMDKPSQRVGKTAANTAIISAESSSVRQPSHPRKLSLNRSKNSKKLIEELKPRLIWPIGTGESLKTWDVLEKWTDFDNGAAKTLAELANKGKYLKYVDIVKESLCSSPADMEGREMLWRQLILTVNSFTLQLIQQRKYAKAIEMLQVAQDLLPFCDGSEFNHILDELNGYIKVSLAFYYSRRDKPSAALKYIVEATSIQKRRNSLLDVVKCDIYRAFILQQLNRYNDAIKLLKSILRIVNDGTLDCWHKNNDNIVDAKKENDTEKKAGNSDPQVVLLVAVTYHNLSCLQLLKGQTGDACMNSQNCRKLSRLCMSVSNRYLARFEETHLIAMNKLFSIVCPRQTQKDAIVLQRLFQQLFSVR